MAIVIEQVTYDYQMASGAAPDGKRRNRRAEAQEIAERLKGLAVRFIVAVNESGFFVPVDGQINYRVAFDKMDANLCIVTLSLTLQEQAGVCFDYGL